MVQFVVEPLQLPQEKWHFEHIPVEVSTLDAGQYLSQYKEKGFRLRPVMQVEHVLNLPEQVAHLLSHAVHVQLVVFTIVMLAGQ